jgi:hypothetical protein
MPFTYTYFLTTTAKKGNIASARAKRGRKATFAKLLQTRLTEKKHTYIYIYVYIARNISLTGY